MEPESTAASRLLVLTTRLELALLAHCRAAYPDEACGALLGRIEGSVRLVDEIVPLVNDTTGDRRDRFAVRPADLLELMRRERETGARVIGFFHSHPDDPPRPSETDRCAAWPEYSYPIVSVSSSGAASWASWRLNEAGDEYERETIRIVPNSSEYPSAHEVPS